MAVPPKIALAEGETDPLAREPAQAEYASALAHALIDARQNVSPKRLKAPGPSPEQVERLLRSAAAAPDHGQLTPWRFVIVPPEKRYLLGEAFTMALADRDPDATAEQLGAARAKAHRAPFLMLAVASLGAENDEVPALERMVSLGAAIQNVLLSALAMGLGSGLTSGKAMDAPQLRRLFELKDDERAVCCINIGTVEQARAPRVRPEPWSFTSTL